MNLEQEIQNLQARNNRVDADKAWEKSPTRKLFITFVTYVVAVVWLLVIDDSMPFLKAFVPAAGYILSTLSLTFLKNWWIQKYNKK